MSLHVLKSFYPSLFIIEEGDWVVEVTLRHCEAENKIPLCSYVLKAPLRYETRITDVSAAVETTINQKEF
jgi:TPP-dependent indolepyruvate ferredoxin oxidoreductase alpha subunit